MLPQQVRSSVEQWKKDQWTDRSFKVLGVEIGNLPASHQFFVCAGGVFAFLLVYGYMQVSGSSRWGRFASLCSSNLRSPCALDVRRRTVYKGRRAARVS